MPHVNRVDGQGRRIVDRRLLAFTSGYAVATIRKYLEPLEYDPETGAALYDQDAAVAQLEALGVAKRPDRQGPRRVVRDARPGRVA